jgi:hypothetical protein
MRRNGVVTNLGIVVMDVRERRCNEPPVSHCGGGCRRAAILLEGLYAAGTWMSENAVAKKLGNLCGSGCENGLYQRMNSDIELHPISITQIL